MSGNKKHAIFRTSATGPVQSLCYEHRLDAATRRPLAAQQEILDAARKEEAGGSVEAAPAQTPADAEPAELRQGAGTWAGGGRWAGLSHYQGLEQDEGVTVYDSTSFL